MVRPLAFYVHHHGSGHANRCKLLARRWPEPRPPLHVFTSAAHRFDRWSEGLVYSLPPDVEEGRDPAGDMLRNQVLHYAPVDLPALSRRMARLAGWIADHQPFLFIVDLSVEVALFTRLCGVPTALMRLHGRRDDPAHRAAYGVADCLLAPFPPSLEDAHTPAWVREKTIYLGAFSRFDERTESKTDARRSLGIPSRARVLTVVIGFGGGARTQVPSYWDDVADQLPDWRVLLVGQLPPHEHNAGGGSANIHRVGVVDDTYPYLKAADLIVGSGGTNTMMEIGAAGVPYLSRPEPRPFDEQVCKMQALQQLGLTRIVADDTAPAAWPALLQEALHMDTAGWSDLRREADPTRAMAKLARQTILGA